MRPFTCQQSKQKTIHTTHTSTVHTTHKFNTQLHTYLSKNEQFLFFNCFVMTRIIKCSYEVAHRDEDTNLQVSRSFAESLKHEKFFDVKTGKNFFVVTAFLNSTLVTKGGKRQQKPDCIVASIICKI